MANYWSGSDPKIQQFKSKYTIGGLMLLSLANPAHNRVLSMCGMHVAPANSLDRWPKSQGKIKAIQSNSQHLNQTVSLPSSYPVLSMRKAWNCIIHTLLGKRLQSGTDLSSTCMYSRRKKKASTPTSNSNCPHLGDTWQFRSWGECVRCQKQVMKCPSQQLHVRFKVLFSFFLFSRHRPRAVLSLRRL